MAAISYRQEIFRKLIHLSSIWMVFAMAMMERDMAIRFFWGLAIAMFLIERSRRNNRYIHKIFDFCFHSVLRDYESVSRMTGATFVILSAALALVFFPLHVAMTAFAIMIVGDTAAALVGMRWGRHKVMDKSLEGSAAFALFSLPVIFTIGLYYQLPSLYYISGIWGIIAGMITELYAKHLKVDDNLSITLVSGCIMLLVTYIF